MCYGKAFYEQYKRRLQYDPIGALHMLRNKKESEVRKIDLVLAAYGLERECPRPVVKERSN